MATTEEGNSIQIIKHGDIASIINPNLTEEKKLEFQELGAEDIKLKGELGKAKVLEAFFKYSVSSVAILDENFNFIFVNDAYAKTNSLKISDFYGHNLFELYSSDAKEIFDNVVRIKETYKAFKRPFIFPNHPEWGVTYWDWILEPILDSSGEVDILILTLNDVTKHTIVQQKLVESEERYRSIFDNSQDGILLTIPDGTLLSANPAACRMLGRTEEELRIVGRNGIVDLNDPRYLKAVKEREATGNFHGEITFLRADGTKFPVVATSNLFMDKNGGVFTSIHVRDITGHQKTRKDLHLSEEKFYKAFHHNQTPMAISSINSGVFIDANSSYADVFGYNREELIGKSSFELNIWADLKDRQNILERLKEHGYIRNYEVKFRKATEEIGYCLSTFSILEIDGEKCLLLSFVDITERKKTEEALRLSEEKFSKAFNNNQTSMSISKFKDSVYIDVNQTFADVMGYTREELVGKSAIELNLWGNPKDRQKILNQVSENGCTRNYQSTFRKKSGEIGFALSSINALELDGENCLLSSLIDITDRKKAEEALGLSEEQFFKLFNANPLPIAIISVNSNTYVDINETFLKKYGYTRDELIGTSVDDIGACVDPKERSNLFQEVMQKGFAYNFEGRLRKKTGEILTVLMSGVLINFNGEECFLGISNDITELRRYQNEIARLDRLHLVGEMSASISHEIRNPMTTVKGFLQLFRDKERYARDKEFIDLMIEELDRANSIITEYLSLAKNKAVELKRQSLNQKVRALYPLLHADALKQDKNIKLELGDIPSILIDDNEIHQLLLNLVRNGLEAMSPGGNIIIKTFMDGDTVVLAVQDQGIGIASEALEKIGTPFFTTKDNGTGLGLAVCHSIAQRHNARIGVETGPDGTTFYVRFSNKEGFQ